MHMSPARLIAVCLVAAACTRASVARAQITSLADDILLITKGLQNEEEVRVDQRLGTTIGGNASTLGYAPGSGDPRPGPTGPVGASGTSSRLEGVSILRAAAGEPERRHAEPLRLPAQQSSPLPNAAVAGLEIPEQEDEGPKTGLTLDGAVDLLLANNSDLRIKQFEIPQARADILTASLRANPLVFGSVSSVPYGNYSTQRPGNISYSATVIYPFDVSHKRASRTDVANKAGKVIEAQFQDAVRLTLDHLYTVYVNVVVARDTLNYVLANRDGLRRLEAITKRQAANGLIASTDLDRISIQLDSADIAVEQAEVTLHVAKHSLGLLLGYSSEQDEQVEVRGSIRDTAPLPPPDNDLVAMACFNRPDLNAYRLGVQRAVADVRLAEAEKTSDVFLLWTPWQLQNNTPLGTQNSTSWSVAAFGSVSLFNRNQGNIQRAQLNVSQTQTELAGLEASVTEEVRAAFSEYWASRDAVDRLERTVLPRSRHIRDSVVKLFANGQASAIDYLASARANTTTSCANIATRWCGIAAACCGSTPSSASAFCRDAAQACRRDIDSCHPAPQVFAARRGTTFATMNATPRVTCRRSQTRGLFRRKR